MICYISKDNSLLSESATSVSRGIQKYAIVQKRWKISISVICESAILVLHANILKSVKSSYQMISFPCKYADLKNQTCTNVWMCKNQYKVVII